MIQILFWEVVKIDNSFEKNCNLGLGAFEDTMNVLGASPAASSTAMPSLELLDFFISLVVREIWLIPTLQTHRFDKEQ